jgi:uncharacterized protein (TIGR03118 family)
MRTTAALGALALGLMATSALATPKPLSDAQLSGVVAGTNFTVVGEISDTMTESGNPADPALVNSWGLSEAPNAGPLWVANNGTGTTTLYNFNTFAKIPLGGAAITVAGPSGAPSAPTGTLFTTPTGNTFDVTLNGKTGHSFFLFDGEDGTISGWAPTVAVNTTVVAVDQSAPPNAAGVFNGAVYKGLALLNPDSSAPQLFAADFSQSRVEVFNSQFQQVNSFTDPTLPPGYAPFNVQVLDGKLYVTFALKDQFNHDDVSGPGNGFVDVFDMHGHKLKTLVSGGPLNSPWGLTIAPESFGKKFEGALLVGNFGDGKINAFDPNNGKFLGTLDAPGGAALSIDGLWALRNGPDGSVVFSSGPDGESHGLVGVIRPSWAKASWAYQSHVVMDH